MTKGDQREAAAILKRLAQMVAAGEVTASAGLVGRLEGAAEALRVLAGPRSAKVRRAR